MKNFVDRGKYISNSVSDALVKVLITVMKTVTKISLGRKEFISYYRV